MAQNIDNSTEQTYPTAQVVIEKPVATPTEVGKSKEVVDDSEEDFDLDSFFDEDESSEDEVPDVIEEDDEPEDKEPVKAVTLSKDQRKIKALKNEAIKLQAEKAELAKKLEEKHNANMEEQLVAQYLEEGHDEREAKKLAKGDVKQSNLEKQLEILMFEKTNRRVLAKYPDSDADLERILKATQASGMTVEQVCRGLYGVEVPAREKRAVAALLDDGDNEQADNTVSKSIRTAAPPVRTKLNPEQLQVKQYLEKKYKRTLTEQEVLQFSK